MNVPKIVSKSLSTKALKKWQIMEIESSGDWDFCSEEGVWRRTQCEENKTESGWQSHSDSRRRMIHYKHSYGLLEKSEGTFLTIKESYIWVHYLLPETELGRLRNEINTFLQQGSWSGAKGDQKFSHGDLVFEIKEGSSHTQDLLEKRKIPKSYGFIECKLYTKSLKVDENFTQKPWGILKTGIRRKDLRGGPREIKNFRGMDEFFPAQIEIGCGPSIEAGVAPLNFLHKLYSVTQASGKFVFSSPEDVFLQKILCDPDTTYKELAQMFYSVLEAKDTPFYEILAKLYKKKYFVGPVITNNFDCIIPYIGLSQNYIRRFEEEYFHPKLSFHKDAKSLWVIGSHADRRGIQKLARKKGLKVLYIDPEGYSDSAGNFESYKLESPQDEDVLFRAKASDAFEKLEHDILK